MTPKLHFAVLHVGQSMLHAVVEDSDGHRRKIKYTWITRDHTDTPAPHWFQAVTGEVDYQQAQEVEAAKGRVIPGY